MCVWFDWWRRIKRKRTSHPIFFCVWFEVEFPRQTTVNKSGIADHLIPPPHTAHIRELPPPRPHRVQPPAKIHCRRLRRSRPRQDPRHPGQELCHPRSAGECIFGKVKHPRHYPRPANPRPGTAPAPSPTVSRLTDTVRLFPVSSVGVQIRREIATLKLLKHPNVVCLHEVRRSHLFR
jgi:hypothetical protein